ncbi:MAG: 2-hydroxyacid dehydrogenase [Undibacterium sp.]|nr:2-hydroxyacid dehydrogenase [Opitutaceae bacterium]
MPTVAVFDTKPYDRDYLAPAALAAGLTCRFHDFRLSAETASAAAGVVAACIFVNDRADHPALEKLAALGVRHLALRCAGYNQVDLPAARALGLTVTRVPAYSPHAVAEHTLALLLALVRKIPRAHNRVRELNFSLAGLVGFDLHGKTAGIIGTGQIGRLTAQILRGFGMKVLATDPAPSAEWAAAHSVTYVALDELLTASDVISLHAPLTPATNHLIGPATLARMKPGVVLVNTSRGRLIDTTALIAALKSGHIGGVALDVYEEEAGVFFGDLSGTILADDELAQLLTFPNVLITAHQAFLTHEALSQIAHTTAENMRRLSAGEPALPNTAL